MSRVFSISSATDAVSLDASGRGSAMFTVTNATARALRGRFRIKPLDAVGGDAIAIEGEPERNFNANDTQQVSVKLNVPPGTKEGKYRFRLDGVSVDDPDDDFTEGPVLAVEVKAATAPKKSIPWWIYAVVALVLVVGGVLGYLYLTRSVELITVTGESYEAAKQQLEALDLKVAKLEEATAKAPAGQVIKQSPTPKEKAQVKKDSTVTLTVAVPLPAPAMVELPNVTGKPVGEASTQLEGLGLKVKQEPSETADAPAGQVIRQAPPPSPVTIGSLVTLTVAAAPNPFVGNWVNKNTDTQGITRLDIAREGDKIKVHLYWKCSGGDCDAGVYDATQDGQQLVSTLERNFILYKMTLTPSGDELNVSSEINNLPAHTRTHSDATFARKR